MLWHFTTSIGEMVWTGPGKLWKALEIFQIAIAAAFELGQGVPEAKCYE